MYYYDENYDEYDENYDENSNYEDLYPEQMEEGYDRPPPPYNLSLSYCNENGGVVWTQLQSKNPSPVISGHDAVVVTINSTEWMVVTGGILFQQQQQGGDSSFRVWALNLTHASIHQKEEWIRMTGPSKNSTLCAESTKTMPQNDPWDRLDLWEYSNKNCAPDPQQGHITAVMNEYLYMFGKYDQFVYRIVLSDVLVNQWSSWQRITPRSTLSEQVQGQRLVGGLWQQNPKELEKLVIFTMNQQEQSVWTYDFTMDAWDVLWEMEHDGSQFSSSFGYNAVVDGDELFATGAKYVNMYDAHPRSFIKSINLVTKTSEETWSAFDSSQKLVSYQDQVLQDSVIVGFGPSNQYDTSLDVGFGIMTATYSNDWLDVEPVAVITRDWTAAPVPRSDHSVVLSYSSGKIYVFGGSDLGKSTEAVWTMDVGSSACNLNVLWDQDGYYTNDPLFDPYDEECLYDCPTPENDTPNFLFLPFLMLLVLICVRSNEQSRGERVQTSEDEVHSGRGLSSQEIDQLPQRILMDTDTASCNEGDGDDAICSICLLHFATGDEVRDLPCKHYFHSACVDSWLSGEPSCPLCRTECQPDFPSLSLGNASSVLARAVQGLRGDHRETSDEEEDGLEMNYVSSLELTEETVDDDATIQSVPSGEQSSEFPSESRRPRRFRRGRHRTGGAAEPLHSLENNDSIIV